MDTMTSAPTLPQPRDTRQVPSGDAGPDQGRDRMPVALPPAGQSLSGEMAAQQRHKAAVLHWLAQHDPAASAALYRAIEADYRFRLARGSGVCDSHIAGG